MFCLGLENIFTTVTALCTAQRKSPVRVRVMLYLYIVHYTNRSIDLFQFTILTGKKTHKHAQDCWSSPSLTYN